MKRFLFGSIVFTSIFCGVCYSQTSTATIVGRVTDRSGAVLPGVSLTVLNENTGLTRTVLSNDLGSYSVPALTAGTYRLEAELSGFKKSVASGVLLQVNQVVRLNFQLELGEIEQSIEVVGVPALLNTDEASVGQVVSDSEIQNLPLNARQFLEFAKLVPGVASGAGGPQTGDSSLFTRPGQNSSVNVSGGRSQNNSFLLDGTQNTDGDVNAYVLSPSVDSVQEFKVQTSNYAAEFGRSSSGQINVITKAGTNDFHGTAFLFHRNDNLDARPFNEPGELPEFRRHQFGASLGGPIERNKSFFFFSYEGLRLQQGQSRRLTVPTLLQRNGDFSQDTAIYDPLTTRPDPDSPGQLVRDPFPGGVIPEDRQNPITRAFMDRFVVAPNLPGSVFNYIDNRATNQDNDQYNGRIDYQLTENDNIFGRYTISEEDGFLPTGLPGSGTLSDVRAQNLSLSHVHTFSAKTVNEFKFGFSRLRLGRLSENAYKTDIVGELGIPGVSFGGPETWGIPSMTVSGFTTFGDDNFFLPFLLRDNNFHLLETISILKGSHSFKVGAELRRFQFNVIQAFTPRGDFRFTSGGATSMTAGTLSSDRSGSPLAAFLLGLPTNSRRTAGVVPTYLRQTATAFYFQDDWKILPQLTLNLGLRYESIPPFVDKYDRISNLQFPNFPSLKTIVEEGITGLRPVLVTPYTPGVPRGLTETDWNNWAPRVGFAFRPSLGNNSFVIRGGGGVFYSVMDGDHLSRGALNVPYSLSDSMTSGAFIPEIQYIGFLQAPSLTTAGSQFSFVNFDTSLRTPYTYQWNLSVQQQFKQVMAIEVAYVGSASHKLDGRIGWNDPVPGPGSTQSRRPFQTVQLAVGEPPSEFLPAEITTDEIPIGLIQGASNQGNSNYHGLQTKFQRRFHSGFSFLTAYTWSKVINDSPSYRQQGVQLNVPPNFLNNAAERGLAGFDFRHRFVQSFVVELPFGAGQRFLSDLDGIANGILGNWKVNGIFELQSGFPVSILATGSRSQAVSTTRADVVEGQNPTLKRSERSDARWFNTEAFALPPIGAFGNAGRNTVTGPGLNSLDFSFIKEVELVESRMLQVRVEFFNLLNHPNYGNPGVYVNRSGYGAISSQRIPARQVQLGLKLNF